ncbi:MAG: FkbM family methyltransferase [Microgenomates group bacterium]
MIFEQFGFNSYYFKCKHSQPIIVDLGANIGDTCIYFKWLYPNARIFAFEPHPVAYKYLIKNIAENNLKNISAFNYGLSKTNSKMILKTPSEENLGASSTKNKFSKSNTGEKFEVEMKRGDEIVALKKLTRIDLLKIDIEGSESEVIQRLDKLLEVSDRVIIEYHLLPSRINNSFDTILKFLEDANFAISVSSFYRDDTNTPSPFCFHINCTKLKKQ